MNLLVRSKSDTYIREFLYRFNRTPLPVHTTLCTAAYSKRPGRTVDTNFKLTFNDREGTSIT